MIGAYAITLDKTSTAVGAGVVGGNVVRMSHEVSIDRAPAAEGGIQITVSLSSTVLAKLHKDGSWTEKIGEGQVTGDGPAIAQIEFKVP
ncbi:hypothetical protein ACWD4O_08285 [Streptomyces sp. NPDC002623]|uniref:hypothetical protein n=2 Tax=Streptomyces TaxID=1883 RepID=UPI00332A61A6